MPRRHTLAVLGLAILGLISELGSTNAADPELPLAPWRVQANARPRSRVEPAGYSRPRESRQHVFRAGHSAPPRFPSVPPPTGNPREYSAPAGLLPGYSAPPQRNVRSSPFTQAPPQIPGNSRAIATPWWHQQFKTPLLGLSRTRNLSVDEAIGTARRRAPEIAALQARVAQRQAELRRENAAFDWTVFADTELNHDNIPVGSALDGATTRLRDRTWDLQAGLRSRNRHGGEFSLFHDYGFRTSNSRFLNPRNQGTGRVTAEYSQPLLRASGIAYNLGAIEMARAGEQVSSARLAAGTEDHLLRVAAAYWNLVRARGELILATRAWTRSQELVDFMQKRRDVDVKQSQYLQAEASLARQHVAWTDAVYETRRAQEILLRLMLGQGYENYADLEVITVNLPSTETRPSNFGYGDLQNHPEVVAASQAIHAASIQMNLARSDLQPRLDLVLSAYSAGLRGGGKINRAVGDAWTDSRPGFGVGLNFEYPLGNRAAQAESDRRAAQLLRLQNQFQTVVSTVTLNIRDRSIAAEKATALLKQSSESLRIAREDLANLETRRELLVDGSSVARLYLDSLLQAQDQLSDAERRVLQAQIARDLSLVEVAHAKGELRYQSLPN